MIKSNENLGIRQQIVKVNQANLKNLISVKQISNLKEMLESRKREKAVKTALKKNEVFFKAPGSGHRVNKNVSGVNPTNHGRLQDQISNASTIGKNQFNSTTNSLHFEKNVVVLKNSKFLFNRLGWLAQEAELPTTNNNLFLSPLATVPLRKRSFFLSPSLQAAGKTEKINYYNTYKTQLQNYIIEKYKIIASIKAEYLALDTKIKPLEGTDLFSEELKKKLNLIEQIRVKNLLKILGAYARNIVKKGFNNSAKANTSEITTSQLNFRDLNPINRTKSNSDLFSEASGNLLYLTQPNTALPIDPEFKWNEKVEKKRLDNIKKGTLLPKNIIQFIAAAVSSNTKTTLITTSRLRDNNMETKPTKEARLRQYLNLISNTNIGVNLAIPTNNKLLLNQPCFSNSLNNNNVAQDLRKIKTSTSNSTGETGQELSLPPLPRQNKAKGLLLTYNKIISYNFLPRPNNTVALAKNTTSFDAAAVLKKTSFFLMPREKVLIEDLNKLLFYYFKSIYCLIGKPVIQFSPDKITINLFYFLNIPKKKVFKLFAIHYLNSFKDKFIRRVINKNYLNEKEKLKNRNRYSSEFIPFSSIQRREAKSVRLPFIKFKYSRSISRLKSKNHFIRSLLFNLRRFNLALVYFRKFKIISKILSNKFNKPIEFNLIRLHKPYLDSNILVNLLQLIVKNKKRKPRVAINKIYSKNKISAPAMQGRLPASLPLGKRVLNKKGNNVTTGYILNNKITSYLSGLSIYINGRLMREPILPRITTKIFESGASATGKVNYLDVSSITKKNRKGAYTIKIKTGQNLY